MIDPETIPKQLIGLPSFHLAFFPGSTFSWSVGYSPENLGLYTEQKFLFSFHGLHKDVGDIGMVCAIEDVVHNTAKSNITFTLRPLFRGYMRDIKAQDGRILISWEKAAETLPGEESFANKAFKQSVQKLWLLAMKFWLLREKKIESKLPHGAQQRETFGAFVDAVAGTLNPLAKDPLLQAQLVAILVELHIPTRFWTTLFLLERLVEASELGFGKKKKKDDAPPEEKTTRNKNIPPAIEKVLEKEKERFERATGTEEGVIARYIEWLESLPWGIATEDQRNLALVQESLDKDHYGLDKAKDAILGNLAVHNLNIKARSPILCFVGSPGTGKTSLGESIARALGRKFVRMSLGGIRDEADIRGHRRTYVASLPGRIISGIKAAGVINPVFMLDELDKVGRDSGQGDPAAALLEVLDPEQNSAFVDHYLEVSFDLSHVLFIGTANVVDTIPKALRSRMRIIHLPGYGAEEKLAIARNFIIPKQLKECGLTPDNLTILGLPEFRTDISDEILRYLIEHYLYEDAGVRDLERYIHRLFERIAKALGGDPRSADILHTEFTKENTDRVLHITEAHIQKCFGDPPQQDYRKDLGNLPPGVAPVLFVSERGGSVGFLEVESRPSDNTHKKITGRLGEVIAESVEVGFTRVRKNHWGIFGRFRKCFLHVHFDEGATPKDGPSAGVVIHAAMYSQFHNIPMKPFLTITGEVTLKREAVLAVGGITEKLLAAMRFGLREVAIPSENKKDLKDLSPVMKEKVDVIDVEGISLKELRKISRRLKDKFTVYCINTPDQALAIAFPYSWGERVWKGMRERILQFMKNVTPR